MVEFLISRDGQLDREVDMPGKKAVDAKPFLKLNTETPLVYS